MITKICNKCLLSKDISEFRKWRAKPSGTQYSCKQCVRLAWASRSIEKRKIDSARHRKRKANRRKDLYKKLAEYLLKHPCVDCGESNILLLEFDHYKDKSCCVSLLLISVCSWESALKEINKCDVRCANCHRIKTRIQAEDLRYRMWLKYQYKEE